MSWIGRFKGSFVTSTIRRLAISSAAMVYTSFSLARAAAAGAVGSPEARVHPMYGVPYSPIVKYGPPIPAVTVPAYSGTQPIGWPAIRTPGWTNTGWPMPFTVPGPIGITMRDVLYGIALAAYVAILLRAFCGQALIGGVWYVRNRDKKE